MTLELRKFQLIEAIMSIRDETLIGQYEESLRKIRINNYEAALKPMTVEELKQRAIASEDDIKEGHVTDIEDWQNEISENQS